MQPFQVLHFLILISLTTTSIEAQYSSKPGCSERCGEAWIPYPFGIGRNCSYNEWYNIDCNSSRAYLTALNNIEMLGVNWDGFTVNVSMVSRSGIFNPVQNSNLVLSNNHGKSPFSISKSNNIFLVQGCGHAAIMENGSTLGGCSTTCTNDSVSDINNCFGAGCCKTTIPHDLQSSFTFNLTGLQGHDGVGTYGSAFLVDSYTYTQGTFSMVEDHSFFPVALSWDETLSYYVQDCIDATCGEISIPYPFGIGEKCSYDEWYVVDCNSSTPYLPALNNVEVLGIQVSRRTITINVPLISDCENPVQIVNLALDGAPFKFYARDNIFVVEGCGNASIIDENGTIVGGCSTTCENETIADRKNCFGIGCCQTTIPYLLSSFTTNITGLEPLAGNGSCGSAFLVDRNAFMEGRLSRQFVPITLGWIQGADLNSTECKSCESKGGHCYPDPYMNSGVGCQFHGSNKMGIIIGVSICLGLFLFLVIIYALYKIIKKVKTKRRKERCFKCNGGLLIRQHKESTGLVDKTILFTFSELEKATDHFNEDRIIGRGGQGTVYKGMLGDGRIIAIKKSKVVDESQLEQFINEVVILSQVNHKNVVKLLGCCLETEVPMLVSEFISNGTLYDLIQDETDQFAIPLNMRLQIATEVSRALSYLHSANSIPIYHRDIKTTNILLDEKYRAKVSDFGTSRLVSIDQTHLSTLVKGTFGYFDPEYFLSSRFTDKSDVYSFGVVLLELLTRQKPISLTRFGEHRSLATHFMLAMEEGNVMSIFDAKVVKEGSKSEMLALADLAFRCLNPNGINRPTMKEVEIRLESMRSSYVPSTVQAHFEHVSYHEKALLTYDGETISTSLTFNDN